MTPSTPLLRAAAATASAAVLAFSITLPTGGAALADSPEPTGSQTTTTAPGCGQQCTQEPTETWTPEARPTRTAKPDDDPREPDGPGPAAPAAPQPTAPSTPAADPVDPTASVELMPAEPAAAPTETEASATPSATAPSSGTPSSSSNWNTPVTRSAKATQAAAVSRQAAGSDGANLPAVAAGVLLVGAGGGAFAWWGRNRIRAH